MSLTDRDRKILIGLVPLIVLGALWFLVFAPRQSDASKVSAQLTKAESSRDSAKAKVASIQTAKADYAKDYESVVRLGKAIPSTVDTPSLIVQLSRAAEGTHISFRKIKTGARSTAVATPAPAQTSTPAGSSSSSGSSSGSSGAPVASGGQSAQSAPGGAAETANNGQQTANNASANAANASPGSATGSGAGSSSSSPSSSSTSTPSTTGTTSGSSAPGLDTVPLEFGFDGSFFDLADFFHRMKRFVRVANQNLRVGGRLMTIDSVNFDATSSFPTLTGEIDATIYLAPKDEGATAGATPSGPSTSTAASSSAAPGAPTNASAPAATSGGAPK